MLDPSRVCGLARAFGFLAKIIAADNDKEMKLK